MNDCDSPKMISVIYKEDVPCTLNTCTDNRYDIEINSLEYLSGIFLKQFKRNVSYTLEIINYYFFPIYK